jgi:hypothetical protein
MTSLKKVTNDVIEKEFEIYQKSWALIKEFYYVTDIQDEKEQEQIWQLIHEKAKVIYYIQGDEATSRLAQNISLSVLDYLADRCRIKERGVNL